MIAQGLLGRLRSKDVKRRAGHRDGIDSSAARRDASGRAGTRDGSRSARGRRRLDGRAVGRRRLGRRARVSLLALAAATVVLGGGWLWFRDSSLVAVEHVTVIGETGPDAGQIRSALVAAARNMTTLDVHIGQLRTAVAPYPVVQDLRVSAQFPHRLRIQVIERLPVGAVLVGGRRIAVAGDGTLMYDVAAPSSLPVVPLRVPPGGKRVTDVGGRDAVAVLAAAPQKLLTMVSQVTTVASHGLVAQIRGGPSIYFGAPSRLQAKWIAAAAVLSDPGSAGALYIDVTDPERPAAGAGAGQAATGAPAATGSPA